MNMTVTKINPQMLTSAALVLTVGMHERLKTQ